MAQEQPRRPVQAAAVADQQQQQPIKYADVFPTVTGTKLADKPVAPRDAAAMQAAESLALGKTQKGGPASVMQSAATKNVQTGTVPTGAVTDVAKNEGAKVKITTTTDNRRVVTERVGDQVLGEYMEAAGGGGKDPVADVMARDAVTIGQALESAVKTAGEKVVEKSDAAAVVAAEVRASGRNEKGGVGSDAQSAAVWNERRMDGMSKKTIGDVLGDAKEKLVDDKPATKKDAEAVVAAEIRNAPYMTTTPGGVAESIATAARINQEKKKTSAA